LLENSGRTDWEDLRGSSIGTRGSECGGSLGGQVVSSGSVIVELYDGDVKRSGGSGIVSGAGAEGDFAVVGLSSGTVDCLLIRMSSSASSAISINLRLLRELVDEEVDPEAVCREHAADSVLSFNSLDVVMGKTVSCGENRSVTALKCTVARALGNQHPGVKRRMNDFTLDQPRAVLRHIFDNNISTSISQKPKKRRYLFKICD